MTGDWIPDHELVRSAGLDIDVKTCGPLTDTALRTSCPGVFAIGNLLHPVDTADVAALDGRHVADPVNAYLRGEIAPNKGVRLSVDAPLRWITPGIIRPDDIAPARRRFLLWTDTFVRTPTVSHTRMGISLVGRSYPGQHLRAEYSVYPQVCSIKLICGVERSRYPLARHPEI